VSQARDAAAGQGLDPHGADGWLTALCIEAGFGNPVWPLDLPKVVSGLMDDEAHGFGVDDLIRASLRFWHGFTIKSYDPTFVSWPRAEAKGHP
jgi:hypothetical protein